MFVGILNWSRIDLGNNGDIFWMYGTSSIESSLPFGTFIARDILSIVVFASLV